LSNVIAFPAPSIGGADDALLDAIKEVELAQAAFAAFKLAHSLKEVVRNGRVLVDLMRDLYEDEYRKAACATPDTKAALRHYTAMADEIQATIKGSLSRMQTVSRMRAE
jgi:hypothetical protein